MDRRQPQVPTCQMGFINVLCKPLYVEWHKLLGEPVAPAIECIEESLRIWAEEGQEPCKTDHNPASGTGCKGGPSEIQVCGLCGILSDSSYPTGTSLA